MLMVLGRSHTEPPAGFQLSFGEDTELLEQFDRLLGGQGLGSLYHGLDVGKSSSGCLFYPLLRIAVAVEDDSLMLSQVLLDQIVYGNIEIVCFLQNVCCLAESFCNDSVQSGVGGWRWSLHYLPYGTQTCCR